VEPLVLTQTQAERGGQCVRCRSWSRGVGSDGRGGGINVPRSIPFRDCSRSGIGVGPTHRSSKKWAEYAIRRVWVGNNYHCLNYAMMVMGCLRGCIRNVQMRAMYGCAGGSKMKWQWGKGKQHAVQGIYSTAVSWLTCPLCS